MSRCQLDSHDHRMHAIRNRALRRVLDTLLLAQISRTQAAQARARARHERTTPCGPLRPKRAHARPRSALAPLRLVKS